MSMKQSKRVVPPIPSDARLQNFSQIIQDSIAALYAAAHVHQIVDTEPKDNDGNIGDIYLGNLATGKKLYAKFSDGWYETSLTKV